MAQQDLRRAAVMQLVERFKGLVVATRIIHNQVRQPRRASQLLVVQRRPGGIACQQRPARIGLDKGTKMARSMAWQRYNEDLPFAAW